MKKLALVLLSCALVAGCSFNTKPANPAVTVYSQDFTGDNKPDTISAKLSTIQLQPELKTSYQYSVTNVTVTEGNGTTLLTITPQGIASANGQSFQPGITTFAAYALGFGPNEVFHLVQIDAQGNGVSAPIVFNWDTVNKTWKLGS